MQAIQRSQYNHLQKNLQKLKDESEVFKLPVDHLKIIVQQEVNLYKLYRNYQEALLNIALLIKQYNNEHQSIRRLQHIHKKYQKRSCITGAVKEMT